MYYLNINNTTIDNLSLYMLTTIKNIENIENIENKNEDENKELKLKKENSLVPKSNIYVNYNKLKSKYNERYKNNTNKLILTDKLFWCFYKIYYNVTNDDLEYINIFKTEKEFKLSVIDKIKENKDLLKKHKIQKNFVEAELTNNKEITLNTFKTLCILYNLNIIVIKDNNTYTRFTNNLTNNGLNLESCIDNLHNYYVIKLLYNKSSNINTNYKVLMNIDEIETQNALNKFYYVKNLDNPLKSFSSYKLSEIIEIAKKLDISINRDDGKKKTKKELYSDSLKKLS